MKNTKGLIAITTITLALLLISSLFIAFSNPTSSSVPTNSVVDTSIASPSVNQATDYGDIPWSQMGGDASWARYGTGPAPSTPDILWRKKIHNILPPILAADGKVFVRNSSAYYALDPFTGDILWEYETRNSWWVHPFVADEDHLIVPQSGTAGVDCLDIDTGSVIWSSNKSVVVTYVFTYDLETKQLYAFRYTFSPTKTSIPADRDFQQEIVRWDFSDLSQPPKFVWATPTESIMVDGGLCYGDGKLFYSCAGGYCGALDAETGAVLWETPRKGSGMYGGAYYNGRYLFGGMGNQFDCFDADTGEVLWSFNPGTDHGNWACGPAIDRENGLVYELNYDTYLYCLDIETGNLVWKYKGPGHMYQGYPTVVDGKVYTTTGTRDYRNPDTGEMSGIDETVCLNSTTGELIWKLPIATVLHDGLNPAYGNLYLGVSYLGAYPSIYVGAPYEFYYTYELWCIGSLDGKPKDWSMYLGDPAHTSEGAGPTNLELKWKTNVNGAVISSPTIVDDIVYVGSGDKNIYALDAETGSEIWSFETGFRVFSSQAVVDGRVYTGADDGNIYCLDASTGNKLWEVYAGGITIAKGGHKSVGSRSSPTVVSGKVYVGSLDGNLYCLDANSGSVNWKFQSPGPIFSTPAVIANDGVYFGSSDLDWPGNATLYKLNPDNGNVIWEKSMKRGSYFEWYSSQVVADGMLFSYDASDSLFYCINATNGDTIWTFPIYATTIGAANYDAWYGKVYFTDLFRVKCANATNGEELWDCWANREVVPAITRAVGKIYITNEEGFLYVVDADTGEKLSWVKLGGGTNIWSTPSLYGNNLFIGTHDFNVYCFKEADLGRTTYYTKLVASLSTNQIDKGGSVTVNGSVSPISAPVPVTVTFDKPDGTYVDVPVTTDANGNFQASYTCDVAGNWTVCAWWEGDESHTSAYSENLSLTVVEAPPPEEGIPIEYIYAAVAIIAIAVIAIGGYTYMKRRKK